MKIAEYKQMMEYLTRPGFNGGGSVRNKTILPKKKPEEEVKKRKIKNFEKAKPALENPKEVKEMILKPKRGLVDEPGEYSVTAKEQKNINAWKKTNPNLKYEDLTPSQKFQVRRIGAKAYSQVNLTADMADDIIDLYLNKKNVPEIAKEITKKYDLKNPYPETSVSNLVNKLKKQDVTIGDDVFPKFTKKELADRPQVIKRGTYDDFKNNKEVFNKVKKFAKNNSLTKTARYLSELTNENFFTSKSNIQKAVKEFDDFKFKKGIGGAKIDPKVTENAKKLLKIIKDNPSLNSNKLQSLSKLSDFSYNSALRILKDPVAKTTGETRVNVPKNLVKTIKNKKDVGIKNVEKSLVKQKILTPKEGRDLLSKPAAAVRTAVQGVGGSVFEHTFPEILTDYIPNKEVVKQLKATGVRTSPLLNYFKTMYDVKQNNLVKQFLNDEISLSKYNSEIKKIRDTVKNTTGGYQTGYIKFDVNKNPTPIVNAKPVTVGSKIFGPATRQKASFFENAKYTLNLLKKYKKDPNNPIFESLATRVDSKDITNNYLNAYNKAVQDYNKAKPFSNTIKSLTNFANKNLNNTFVNALFKTPYGKAATGVLLGTTLIAAGPRPTETDLIDEVALTGKTGPGKGLAGAFGAAITAGTKKGRDIAKKLTSGAFKGFGKAFLPLGTPTATYGFAKNLFVDPTLESIKKGEKIKSSPLQNFAIDVSLPISAVAPTAQAINLFGPSTGGFFKRTAKDIAKTALGGGYATRGLDALSRMVGLQSKRLGPGIVSRFVPNLFRAATVPSIYAAPLVETAIQGYNAYKDLQEARKKYGMDDTVTTALGQAPRKYVQELISELPEVDRSGAAGGGIMKMAGKPSGPPPEAGPTPQGLDFLMKRGR